MELIKKLSSKGFFWSFVTALGFLFGLGFFFFAFKDVWEQALFYSRTKNVPFVVGNFQPSVQLQATDGGEQAFGALVPQDFQIVVRKDGQGNLSAVWDDKNYSVWGITIFEVPKEQSVALLDPLFLIRRKAGEDPSKNFLESPYVLGASVEKYEILPVNLPKGQSPKLENGHEYILQALNYFLAPEGPQVKESRHHFIYEQ